MPELPDITVYVESLQARVAGKSLARIRLASPFLLRTYEPPVESLFGKKVAEVRRMGKRIVFGLEGELFAVLHLMIAGRLHWKKAGAGMPGKIGLAAFDFPDGSLILTESGTRRRASLHVVQGWAELRQLDPGGLEVLDADLPAFHATLTSENHTLKRALTDPHLFSGIGNSYSDEILHAARLSPLRLTSQMTEAEVRRLYEATRRVLTLWTDRLRAEAAGSCPEKVTAFRDGMAVHGRFREPCPECGTPVQRIVFAENEMNYCPACQTGGRLLADRAFSRLLRSDWPRSLDEIDQPYLGAKNPRAAEPKQK